MTLFFKRTILFFLLSVLLFSAVRVQAHAAIKEPEVVVNYDPGIIQYRYRNGDIKCGDAPPDHVAGCTHSQPFYDFDYDDSPQGEDKIVINLGFRPFFVDLSTEYEFGSCRFNIPLKHELTHVALYRSVMEKYVKIIGAGVKQRVIDERQKGNPYIKAAIWDSLKSTFKDFQKDSEKQNALLDKNYVYQWNQCDEEDVCFLLDDISLLPQIKAELEKKVSDENGRVGQFGRIEYQKGNCPIKAFNVNKKEIRQISEVIDNAMMPKFLPDFLKDSPFFPEKAVKKMSLDVTPENNNGDLTLCFNVDEAILPDIADAIQKNVPDARSRIEYQSDECSLKVVGEKPENVEKIKKAVSQRTRQSYGRSFPKVFAADNGYEYKEQHGMENSFPVFRQKKTLSDIGGQGDGQNICFKGMDAAMVAQVKAILEETKTDGKGRIEYQSAGCGIETFDVTEKTLQQIKAAIEQSQKNQFMKYFSAFFNLTPEQLRQMQTVVQDSMKKLDKILFSSDKSSDGTGR